jgi:hypothetical protein
MPAPEPLPAPAFLGIGKETTMQTEDEKAEEILRKRRLAAKGLKVREDGKPVDPLADIDSLDPDDKDPTADPPEERQEEIADAAVAGQLGLRR